ncbi:DUF2268 domain-containing protein [Ectobacillus sp. SYSU M60031]|uniref:DUF2268 domain-containing protein n=1 Tax=Ectobacillus ponti TaxID=2961894 RepID=A0AA41X7W4_9BACI|nr:DUF2268 domain-containing protein [Ectobacillus ponti]MCP8968299.1 DUF2268 domain-containing protein [Ectobacillus ponti]
MPTDEWLREQYEDPAKLCEQRLRDHVPLPPSHIYRFLAARGMYRPVPGGLEEVKELQQAGIWRGLRREYQELRRWLQGPDIPVYIFPSDAYNRRIQREYGGKSGLAFPGCLFIFVSSRNELEELKAVLTHEYHHVCRLQQLPAEEHDGTLLDSMIMEGLAEAAVRERHGSERHAAWVSYYTKEEAVKLWSTYLEKFQQVGRGTRKHEDLLNGLHIYPRMLGYAVGFYIVEECMQENRYTTRQLLGTPAEKILQQAPSFAKTRP